MRRCHEADKRAKNAQLVRRMNAKTNVRKLLERLVETKAETIKLG